MEAQKLRKKLNGTTLKGNKVRVEEARPEKKRKSDAQDDAVEEKPKKKIKREKRKSEQGVLSGHELEEGRRVKRGWTDAGKADQISGQPKRAKTAKGEEVRQLSDAQKLRFKTTVPPNAAPVVSKASSKPKLKEPRPGRATRKSVVVQEFTKTRASVVVEQDSKKARRTAAYEDGKGWLDESGQLVEAGQVTPVPQPANERDRSAPSTNDYDESDDEQSASSEIDGVRQEPAVSADEGEDEAKGDDDEAPLSTDIQKAVTPEVSSVQPDGEASKEVHPLEALFKRPASKQGSATKPKPGPIDTSFSFFDPTEVVDEHEAVAYPPQTPHTKQDMEWRSVRSAAPTPDTAAFGKRMSFPFAHEDDEDEDESDDAAAGAEADGDAAQGGMSTAAVPHGDKQESEFRKAFYDSRGDLNRAWKKLRRDERKAKRQRENRRLSRRVV